MRRLTVPDIILSIVVIALAAFTLVPAIARIQRTGLAEAKCQANLQRLAEAMELYCADHQGVFPTNRFISGGLVGAILTSINLSPPDPATWADRAAAVRIRNHLGGGAVSVPAVLCGEDRAGLEVVLEMSQRAEQEVSYRHL